MYIVDLDNGISPANKRLRLEINYQNKAFGETSNTFQKAGIHTLVSSENFIEGI